MSCYWVPFALSGERLSNVFVVCRSALETRTVLLAHRLNFLHSNERRQEKKMPRKNYFEKFVVSSVSSKRLRQTQQHNLYIRKLIYFSRFACAVEMYEKTHESMLS